MASAIAQPKLSQNPKLDPKLRRLASSVTDNDLRRLRSDVVRGFVVSAIALDEEESVDASQCSKRLLVSLNSPQPPPIEESIRWEKVVDNIYSVELPVSSIERLATLAEVEYVEAAVEWMPFLNTSVPETRAHLVHTPPSGTSGLDGTGVAVGIIDFGFDYTLDDFRDLDGSTRVAFLWDQSLDPEGGEHSPDRFGYGAEYDAEAINAALNSGNDPFSVVRHRPDPGSHGTHVAGIAAGNGRSGDTDFPAGEFVGTAPAATLIFVQPEPISTNPTFTDSVRVAEAIEYVFEKAEQLEMPASST